MERERFGNITSVEIDEKIDNATPINTLKTQKYVWRQFNQFCGQRNYELCNQTTDEEIAGILKDWAFNMKRADGTEYKEGVVKTIWNISAKLVQKKYYDEYRRKIDPFKDIIFEDARKARTAKRKLLQVIPGKRKPISVLSKEEISKIVQKFDENTPNGLQKKFYQLSALELAWRGSEASACLIDYFKKEINHYGELTDRIEYNTKFSKTATSKWLTPNKLCRDQCPVRLLEKMLSKRTPNIKTNRLFLTQNPEWQKSDTWYKNSPVGVNQLRKWTCFRAKNDGLSLITNDITNFNYCNNSFISILPKPPPRVNLQEIVYITGHTNNNLPQTTTATSSASADKIEQCEIKEEPLEDDKLCITDNFIKQDPYLDKSLDEILEISSDSLLDAAPDTLEISNHADTSSPKSDSVESSLHQGKRIKKSISTNNIKKKYFSKQLEFAEFQLKAARQLHFIKVRAQREKLKYYKNLNKST